MSLKLAKQKIKERTPQLGGEFYEEMLKNNGFEGRCLQQAKYFLDIMNYQNTNARVVDFLDTYSLYHYYIFRKAINNRFFKYIKENPGLSKAKKCYAFEQIVREEINKHCEKYCYEGNAFFRRSKLSLIPTKMDSNKAKRLVLELNKAPEEIKKMLIDKIESVVNQTVGNGRKLQIKEIFINPQVGGANGALIKKSNPNIRRGSKTSGTIITNVKSVLKAPEKTTVVSGTETTITPNPPNITKPRIVEVSKLPPFVSERTKRKNEEKRRKEEERLKKEEAAKKYTQMTLFPPEEVM